MAGSHWSASELPLLMPGLSSSDHRLSLDILTKLLLGKLGYLPGLLTNRYGAGAIFVFVLNQKSTGKQFEGTILEKSITQGTIRTVNHTQKSKSCSAQDYLLRKDFP